MARAKDAEDPVLAWERAPQGFLSFLPSAAAPVYQHVVVPRAACENHRDP